MSFKTKHAIDLNSSDIVLDNFLGSCFSLMARGP